MNHIVDTATKHRNLFKSSIDILGIALIYAFFGWLGQSLAIAIPPGNVTAVWPPSGFALAMILLLGKRAWGGIILGAFIINTQAFFEGSTVSSITSSITVGISIGIGSLLQPVVGANLIQKFSKSGKLYQTVNACLVFVCVIPVMCLISSTIGSVSLYLGGFTTTSGFSELWFTWWLGDSAGILILTPFLITWFYQKDFSLNTIEWLELVLVVALLLLFTFISFGVLFENTNTLQTMKYLIWPFLLWLALRFRPCISISGMLTVCIIAIWQTTQGSGPFQLETSNLSLLMLQLFLIIIAISVMLVTSLVNERAEVVEHLKSANKQLEKEVAVRNSIEEDMRKMHLLLESKYQQTSNFLQDKESDLQAIIESAPVCIHEIDNEGKLMSMNPAGLNMMGVDDEAAIQGLDYMSIARPEDRQRIQTLFDKALEGVGSEFEFDIPVDDSTLYFSSCFAPITNKEGRIIKVMGVTQDQTERIELEEQIRRTQKLEAVGQLSGGIAHDFNNILGIVQGNLELLKIKFADNKYAMRRVDEALRGISRGSELTRKLLGFSRIQSHSIQHISANTILGNIQNLISRSLTASIQVKNEFAEDLWDIDVDTGDFEDAIMNLSLNARDAMPDGGILTISTSNTIIDSHFVKHNPESQQGEYVVVSFADNGSGMTDEVKERAFEPFYTTKEVGKGTGLGLSMVFGFIKRSGGFIKIESIVDEGTNIKLYLPRSTQKNHEETQHKEMSALPRGTETILIVDDEESLRNVASIGLEQLGYEVEVAENSEQALQKLENNLSIDLMFTDIIMPGSFDGRQLALQAYKHHPQLKILLTSGFIPDSANLEIENANDSELLDNLIQNYLHKPYSRSQLAVAIRQLLDDTTNC